MTEHPENTPVNRFFAFVWALGAVLVFGVLGLVIAGVGSAGDDGMEAYDSERAADRSAKLVQVREAQSKLLAGNGEAVEGAAGKIRVPVEVAAEMVLKEIGESVPQVTAVPVPGSPAALELMEKQAAEQAASEKKAAGEEKPAAKEAPTAEDEPAAPKKAGGEIGKGKGEGKGKAKSAPKTPLSE